MGLIYTMETKPQINHHKTIDQIKWDLENRLKFHNLYHLQTERVANSILNMMLEKTQMYGGNDTTDEAFDESLDRSYYELMRKANRLNTIRKQIKEGNLQARKEYLDTIIDVVGYGLMSLVDLSEELQS